MTNKSLILGVVTLCALPASALAQVTLLSENFNGLGPVNTVSSGAVGTQFTGTNFRILGHTTAPCIGAGITATGERCFVLTGLSGFPAGSSLVSKPVSLVAGVDYLLSFDAFGNAGVASGNTAQNVLRVTLGDDFNGSTGMTFTLSNHPVSGGHDVFSIVPTSTQSVQLMFSSLSTGIGNQGPVLDNILLKSVPEPATLGLMALGLLGAGFAVRKRRN